ncbi:MAG: hypothetical protein GY869_23120, partial [Planctomycetes bacterium]|nr:hypothetical protein [Planctomycetota bacterium]
MKTMKMRLMMLLLVAGLLPLSGAWGQSEKKVLTLEDYGKWSRVSGTSISDNGEWVSYGYRSLEGDSTLYIENLETDKIYEIVSGTGVVFSKDGEWAGYRVSKPDEKPEDGKENEIESGVILLNLQSGETFTFENASSFQFAPKTDYLLLRKPKADRAAEHNGSDLILHNMETHLDLNIGNVGSFVINRKGTLLAYTIDAENKAGNGVFILVLATGQLKPLDTDEALYAQMKWDDEGQEASLKNSMKGTALAVLKGNEKEGFT